MYIKKTEISHLVRYSPLLCLQTVDELPPPGKVMFSSAFLYLSDSRIIQELQNT